MLGAIESLGPEPAFAPVAAAAAAAVAVALLPRIGWLFVAAGLCAWLVSPDADRQGTALVLAAAAAPIPFLLPRAGLLWSVPVLAPLLGTIALAPVFVGIAALAPTPWRRARPRGRRLHLARGGRGRDRRGAPVRSPRRGAAARRLGGLDQRRRLRRARPARLESRPRRPPRRGRRSPSCSRSWCAVAGSRVDLIGAGLWAAGLIVAHIALGDMLAATTALDEARGMVAGSVGAALVALAVSQIAAPAEGWRAQPVPTA